MLRRIARLARALVAAEILDDLGIAQTDDLAAIVALLKCAGRASDHAGRGRRLRTNQLRRHRS